MVVLPEGALSGYDDELSGLDSLDSDELAGALAVVAAAVVRAEVHLFCGSLQLVDGYWRNAALYFSPTGGRWTYYKVNLATNERGRLAAGDSLPVLSVPLASASVGVGVQMCREIRYPEQWQVLARAGAQLITYLTYAANPREPPGVWRSHLISRAAETQRFVVAANVAHPHQHCPSMIISPRGQVLVEASARDASSLRAELDLDDVADWYLGQQRADVVSLQYLDENRPGARDGARPAARSRRRSMRLSRLYGPSAAAYGSR
ncbi:MAG: carbon-nitrogen hydrolase family protein [Acidimicrobiales bacterium]